MASTFGIAGFLPRPKLTAGGKTYHGRFLCPDLQWIGEAPDLFGTFTVTAQQLADAAESGLLWTDQDVQRGIKPEAIPRPPRELSLANGYPNSSLYVFDSVNADAIVDKLLIGEQLFLNALIWNLRPGTFEAYWDEKEADVYLYSGKVFLPDSHHRHQAIAKAVKLWHQSPRDYPRFTPERQFKVELYFLSREDEGNYFFDKNQRPKPTAKSKAYDLTTLDDLSLLAKKVIEKSSALQDNVNRVTDRLTSKNPQVLTLSTLREMTRTFAGSDEVDSSELEGLATIAARFYDMLSVIRPELSRLDVVQRKSVRERSLVDSAVMMHGYAALMRDFNEDLARLGPEKGEAEWTRKLGALARNKRYEMRSWSGDLFDKRNPLWAEAGIVKSGRGQQLTTINTGAARIESGRILRQLVTAPPSTTDLEFLAKR